MFGAPSTQPQARGLIGSRRSRWGHHGRQERFSTLGKRGAEEVITALLPHQVVDKTPNAKDLKHAKRQELYEPALLPADVENMTLTQLMSPMLTSPVPTSTG